MITIEDGTLPITVAEKIINGQLNKRDSVSLYLFSKDVYPDMFTIDEIREIAKYLMVYCEEHTDDYYGGKSNE